MSRAILAGGARHLLTGTGYIDPTFPNPNGPDDAGAAQLQLPFLCSRWLTVCAHECRTVMSQCNTLWLSVELKGAVREP